MLYSFGQPADGIIQMAYIVPDIRQAMQTWMDRLKVGPWFLLEHFTGEEAVYRGEPSLADVAIAMSYAGHMQIELIQPRDGHPSVYREVRETRGFGFHHFGVATDDFDADVSRYEAAGYDLAFCARVPTGGRVGYMDAGTDLPGMLELIEGGPELDETFTRFYRAFLAWDGTDPVRPFA